MTPVNIRMVLPLIAICSLSGGAYAAEETGILDVTATVHDTCDVSLTALAFGDMENAVPTSGTAQVDIKCTTFMSPDPTISLGAGENFDDDLGLRTMALTVDPTGAKSAYYDTTTVNIPYKLGFEAGADATVDAAWTTMPLMPDNGFQTNSTTLYGTTVSTPRAAVGSYSDSVVVTVAYTLLN